MDHVCIRREGYVAGTRERPEVGIFTQTHVQRPPRPWDRIAIGDTIWMKWSGGPIVATARVQGFRQFVSCTPDQLRAATAGYKLHDLDDYWNSLSPFFFAVAIYLENEEWLKPVFVPVCRSRGESWIVLDKPDLRTSWLTPRDDTLDMPPPAPETPVKRQYPGRGFRRVSASLRFEVLRRDNFQCRYCGQRPPEVILHADHVEPWSAGGANALSNMVAACARCNLGKGARRLTLPHLEPPMQPAQC